MYEVQSDAGALGFEAHLRHPGELPGGNSETDPRKPGFIGSLAHLEDFCRKNAVFTSFDGYYLLYSTKPIELGLNH